MGIRKGENVEDGEPTIGRARGLLCAHICIHRHGEHSLLGSMPGTSLIGSFFGTMAVLYIVVSGPLPAKCSPPSATYDSDDIVTVLTADDSVLLLRPRTSFDSTLLRNPGSCSLDPQSHGTLEDFALCAEVSGEADGYDLSFGKGHFEAAKAKSQKRRIGHVSNLKMNSRNIARGRTFSTKSCHQSLAVCLTPIDSLPINCQSVTKEITSTNEDSHCSCIFSPKNSSSLGPASFGFNPAQLLVHPAVGTSVLG
ncbi:hypothetical protein ACRRTK_013172 [Alexandromys fortis]